MTIRRSHYEIAFERYLTRLGVAFVSVEDVKRNISGGPGIKLFDYIVYPGGEVNYLVDVKGRKVNGGKSGRSRTWKSWVTAADIAGLTEWEAVFGAGFRSAFVFAHWLDRTGPWRDADVERLAGRNYSFQLVLLDEYRAHQRVLSPRWRTVTLSRADFVRLARTPSRLWNAQVAPVAAGP